MKTVMFVSGKGGTGKTTILCNLAAALTQKEYSVSVFDADFCFPTCYKLLSPTTPIDEHQEKLEPVRKEYDLIKLVSTGIVFKEEGITWKGENSRTAISSIVRGTNWKADYLLIDLPASTSDELLITVDECKKFFVPSAVVVTMGNELAVLSLRRVLGILRDFKIPVSLIVKNFSNLFSDEAVEEVGSELGVPVLRVPFSPLLMKGVLPSKCSERFVFDLMVGVLEGGR